MAIVDALDSNRAIDERTLGSKSYRGINYEVIGMGFGAWPIAAGDVNCTFIEWPNSCMCLLYIHMIIRS